MRNCVAKNSRKFNKAKVYKDKKKEAKKENTMGAFDGYNLYSRGYPDLPTTKQFIKGQPQFHLSDEFTLKDLKELLAIAQKAGRKELWTPSMKEGFSGVLLSTWYVAALVQFLESGENP